MTHNQHTTPSHKVIFAGTPAFAAVALNALLASAHKVVAVFTQPDRPAGRGRKLTASPVKELALAHGLPVYQPESLKTPDVQAKLQQLAADVMVVAAYGILLPQAVLTIPRLGCINIHPSLLPRWRGAAPIQRTILAGDAMTGVTIMQMDVGLDTGPMLYQTQIPVARAATSVTLHNVLADLGAEALLTTLAQLDQLKPIPQDPLLATYAQKLTKEEARLNWQLPAIDLVRQVHGFNPWPVAYIDTVPERIRVWEASAVSTPAAQTAKPGEILQLNADGMDVATADGVLRITQLQWPGGRVLTLREALTAPHPLLSVGQCLP